MNVEDIYRENNALLEGHFLLSSGNHSRFYLQSAKILENPILAEKLSKELLRLIKSYNLEIDCVCSPAIGGILAGYELARALNTRFIFLERVNGKMMLRRGFEVEKKEKILICEDIITTGGSALEVAHIIEQNGAEIVGFAALANRGFCKQVSIIDSKYQKESKLECKLPTNKPLFALANFDFEIYSPEECPLCKDSKAYKPGSRN